MSSLTNTIESLLRGGFSHGHPWVAVRFRDLWEEGLHAVRSDKLENAMSAALQKYGIGQESYITLVSKHGQTVYIGNVEAEDGEKIADILAFLDTEVLDKPAPRPEVAA